MKKFLLLIFFLNSAYLNAVFFKVKIIPEKKNIYLGERTKIKILITSDEKIKKVVVNFNPYKDIYISKKDIKISNKKAIVTFYIQFFSVGLHTFPKINLVVNGIKIYTDKVKINVISNLKGGEKFRDVKPPEKVSFYLTKDEIIVLIFLVLLLILVIIFFKVKGKKEKLKGFKTDFYTSYEEFLKNIKICEQLLNEIKIKEFYFLISYSLRRYIDRKFKVNTLKMTISEIEKLNIPDEIKEILKEFDDIKFTKKIPSIKKANSHLEKVKLIVKNVENSKF